MAAASAGSLQPGSSITGIVPSSSSGGVESQMSSVLQPHHQQQQQQQQSPPVLQQQQLQSHQQNLQFHQSPHSVSQQRHSYLPRVGNESHLSATSIGRHASGGCAGDSLSSCGSSIIAGLQPLQQQQQQQPNAMIQRQSHMTNAANLAPGWRRVVSNNEVVYISPSGASLRTYGQIKDYLLSPGTCKCGLPCPLRPEYFFDFNSQVPNLPLQMHLDNGLSRSSLMCLHQRRFIESQQNLLQKDMKRRNFNDMSTSGKIITSPASQCNSVAVYSGNVMQTSQVVGNSGRMQMMAPQLVASNQQGVSNVTFHPSQVIKQQSENESLQIKAESDKQIGSVTLSKTPPWRKNLLLQGSPQVPSQNQITNVTHPGQMYSNNNERVPPLPQAHLCQPPAAQQVQVQSLTPPWQHDPAQARYMKTRSPMANKKKPNFKDDPTGYMDHQTAILHNSMMNVVQNPDLNDTGYESIEAEMTTRSSAQKPTQQQIKIEQGISVMQQNQNNIYHPNPVIEIKAEQVKVESPSTTRTYSNSLHGYHPHQTSEQHASAPPTNFVYNQHARVIGSNQAMEMSSKQHQQLQPVPQQVIANVPSSQQVMLEKNSHLLRGQYQCEDQPFGRPGGMSQATTTTIGGQTVTHFPNGMVQVEQNCDSVAPLKPQQQIQLQQQIQQQNILFRQNQQIQKSLHKATSEYQYVQNTPEQKIIVATSQESPVSSSTTFSRCTPERRNTPDGKGPPQVGAVSTSNQSPHPCPSPAESPESSTSIKITSPHSTNSVQAKPHHGMFATSQTSGRNTITSVTAGKTVTATTSVNDRISMNLIEPSNEIHQPPQKLQQSGNIIPASGIHIQQVMREPGNQLIMTSTGQLLVVPSQSNKSSSQVIINNPNGNNLVMNSQPNVLLNQQNSVVNNPQIIGNSVDCLGNQSNTQNIIQNTSNGIVIQNSNIVQSGQNIIQSSNNLISNNGSNFIVNSAGNIQPLILNNSNLIQQNGQNLIAANASNLIQNSAGSGIMTANSTSKVISSSGSVINNQNIIGNQSNVINNQVLGNSGNVISANNGGIIGQQTVVLNTLPNGYMIQPNFATTTVDGQMVGQIVNQENNNAYLQSHQQRQIILTSPESKRKCKKRKSSASSSPSTPSSLSPQQSPTAPNISAQSAGQPQGTMVQITPQYPPQGFQISPGIQGIVVNKNSQNTQHQQQILFQNGQIIQPVNLIGQQLLVPAGLVVTPETTLVQIQNVGPCGSLITPQGMVLRAPSPQNKNFLSPNAGSQQFIVGGSSQVSPLGQIYGTPVSLVVPQSNSGAATFVQQNTTIMQQQPAIINNYSSPDATTESNLQHQNAASPPDTTTHSPRSPERPPSEKSGGSDMVQCVSSSEPDSVVSPPIADSAQSPTTTEFDRSGSVSYHVYKPSDAKIRKIETPTQFSNSTSSESMTQVKPDSHESPTNSPPVSATSTTSSLPSSGSIISGSGAGGCGGQLPSFSIGELVWGAARGHPAWPGKILNPPEGICTPSDSTWVQWFGGRPNVELVAINSLKSLSEGLEAHHKAQKDTRKSRKLNSQLERAIQEAMAELDRMSSTAHSATQVSSKNRSRGRQHSSVGHQRTKPVKIAPAPPCGNNIQQIRQQTTITQVTHHQQSGQQQTSTAQTK